VSAALPPPPPPPPPPAKPADLVVSVGDGGWIQYFDELQGRKYYHNYCSGALRWERPEGL
jgi:hypothetical protein